MQAGETPDRRGRLQRGEAGLLERERELAAIEDLLEGAAAGHGAALLIEGHPGMGKSRLHEAALDRARGQEMSVLRAAGSELERSIAFGVAVRLLNSHLADLPPRGRLSAIDAAPPALRTLLGGGAPSLGDHGDGVAVSHAIFTLLAASDPPRSILIAIDDLHWVDQPSLEFLLYLLHRLDELPAAVVMTRRPADPAMPSAVLDQISVHPRVRLETLAPLGGGAVAQLAREQLGARANGAVLRACLTATAGNPFYLRELLAALDEDGPRSSEELARQALALAPDAVTRIVRVRIGRLGDDAAALARAVAVLGDDVPLRHAAALARLELGAAAVAADRLGAMEVLLAREPLRFVHPLVRQVVLSDIPASEQASRHLEAARLLHGEGADIDHVAAHLLHGRPQGDPWVVDQLRVAAAGASRRGAADAAADYLSRALAEPPPGELRSELLAELGSAEAMSGRPTAAEHLAAAAALVDDPRRRAELALERGRALDAEGLHDAAAETYEHGLGELGDADDVDAHELQDQLAGGFVASALLAPGHHRPGLARAAALADRLTVPPRRQGERLLLAQAAMQAAFAGRPADEVSALAQRAWDGGRLLAQAAPQWLGWRLASGAFCLAGDLERAIALADSALTDAARRTWPLGLATAAVTRAIPRLWRGEVDAALADLEAADDARRYGWRQLERSAAAFEALCLIEKGDLVAAEAIVHRDGPLDWPRDLEDAQRVYALGECRLAQGNYEAALTLAHRAGRLAEEHVRTYGYVRWRTLAAQALVGLGESTRAIELAEEADQRAQATGILHQRIRTLRVLGLCRGGDEGTQLLEDAVALGEAGPPRLETIRALVDLGAALRRANQRSAAREPLGLAVDLARRGGATAVHDQARLELRATGARPRRDALLSGPASLTPSERRIAELAALGQSNREISQTLFVTPKTVEYHLSNVYRKLGIETRRDLSRALAA